MQGQRSLTLSRVQYKTFSWGDVLANLLGSSLGLFLSYHAERRYRTKREIARLYQPLDAQDYDDGDSEGAAVDEDEEAGTAWAAPVRQATAEQGKSKKVRFGNPWDAEAEGQEEAQVAPAREQASGSTAKPKSPQDLFSIDDDEDEDEDSPLPSASFSQASAPEAEAWRGDQ